MSADPPKKGADPADSLAKGFSVLGETALKQGAKMIPGVAPIITYQNVQAARPGETNFATEAPAPQAEVVLPAYEGQLGPAQKTSPNFSQSDDLGDDPVNKAAGVGSRSRIKGVIEPGNTAQEAVDMAAAQARIRQSEKMIGFAYGQAGKVSQQWHRNMADLFATDSDEVYRMIREEFPKFKEAQRKLQDDLEDIRSLRVNPYQYLQTAGRGGRAGAVLATMVGQMASGASGINHARIALKNAIDRDIETQASNIELQFKGVEAASGNIQDQLGLLQEEILFRDKAQAYAWEAASAVIKSALQGAANEATYLGLQVLDDYATIQAAAAAAALRAKQSSLYLEEPARNLAQIQKGLSLGAQGLQALQTAFKTGQQSGQVQAPPDRPDLKYSDPALQAQSTQARQDVAPLAAQPQQAAPAPAAEQPKAKPASRRGKGGGGFKADMSFTPEEAEFQSDMVFSEDEAGIEPIVQAPNNSPEEAEATAQAVVQEYQERYFNQPAKSTNASKQLTSAGSDFVAKMRAKNVPVFTGPGSDFETVGQMVYNAVHNPSTFFSADGNRAQTLNDAKNVMVAFRNEAPKTEKNKYIGKFPENFEANTTFEGFSNTETSRIFGTMKLRADPAIRDTAGVIRKDVRESIQKADRSIIQLRRAAELVKLTDQGSFLGFRYDPEEDSWEFTKTDESQVAALSELEEILKSQAIQWIKTHDPSGRLSDQDVKLAESVMNKMANSRGDQLISILERAFTGGSPSSIQKGMSAYFKSLAIQAEINLHTEIGAYTVKSPEAWARSRELANETRAFLLKRFAEQGLDPPASFDEAVAAPGQ